MTSPRIHRFDFNTLRDFRGPIVMKSTIDPLVVDVPPPPPAPVYGEQELEEARLEGKKQGYLDGFAAGKREAAQQADEKTAHANEIIAALANTMTDMRTRYLALLSHESAALSPLVLAIGKKLSGSLIETQGAKAIEALLTQCLPVIFSKPKLIIEMHPNQFESSVNHIETQLQQHGFEGEIQFKANPDLGTSDAIIDWGNGQMQRNADALWEDIEALIAQMPLTFTLSDEPINQTPTGD